MDFVEICYSLERVTFVDCETIIIFEKLRWTMTQSVMAIWLWAKMMW
jgi:hypothetical protein